MTLYLLDTNTLIRAHEDYYPVDRIPQFWEWLWGQSLVGNVAMPSEIYDEASKSPDARGEWLRRPAVKSSLVLGTTDAVTVTRVLQEGYAPDLDDVEIGKIGADAFLIAAAICAKDCVVVTREVSRPTAQRANRKVPDVCGTFKVRWMTDFAAWRALDFRIAP